LVHGGRSTGPRTQQGRNLCGAAKTLHGRETRAIRAKRQQALAELKLLERMGKGFGIMLGEGELPVLGDGDSNLFSSALSVRRLSAQS
jgi:hypothetical protein